MTTQHDYEVSERVAILKKLRKALLAQREKFREYLAVLERQETDIIERDADKLEAHVELEQMIVREIYSFQKVIDPLSEMYRIAYPAREHDVVELETSLEHLREQVLDRNQQNQELLKEYMVTLRRQIADIRSGRTRKLSYGGQPAPSLIDINA